MSLPKNKQQYVLWIQDIESKLYDSVGRKASTLAKITKNDIPTPKAFVVLPSAFSKVVEENHLIKKIHHQITNIDIFNPHDVSLASQRISNLIMSSDIPKYISMQIFDAYHDISDNSYVAIRGSKHDSSGVVSHQKPFLGIIGDTNVVEHIKKMWAAHFSHKYITTFINTKEDISSININIIVEHMINSDSSGTVFTQPPDGYQKSRMYIQAAWGIRDEYVDSSPYPDLYTIDKESLEITQKEIIDQHTQIKQAKTGINKIDILDNKKSKQKLSDENILQLSKIASKLQKIFFFPQKIEWAKAENQIYILDSQDINSNESISHPLSLDTRSPLNNLKQIASGTLVVPGVVSGHFKDISSKKMIEKIKSKDIILTTADLLSSLPLRKISALLLKDTSPTDQNLILIKDLGIPSIIIDSPLPTIKPGTVVTLNSNTGLLYQGSLPAKTIHIPKSLTNIELDHQTATKLYANISEMTEQDLTLADGIGILRSENLYEKSDLPFPGSPIKVKTSFINKLTGSINKVCDHMKDKPVFYRLSDSKNFGSLGLRGVSMHFLLPDTLKLEAKAFLRAKEGNKNLHLLLPFIRTSNDIIKIKRALSDFGINRSQGLKVWIMAEVPSCLLTLKSCIEAGVDGVIIGLNDLTMLTLGVDRSEGPLVELYNEKHESILNLINEGIKTCIEKKVPCFLAGEGIDIHPDIIEKAISWGISGLSVSPGSLPITKTYIRNSEKKLIGIKNK